VNVNCSSAPVTNYTTGQFTTLSHNSTITAVKDGLGIKISPNPVGGNAIIDYIVPATGRTVIILSNAVGQKLKTIANVDVRQGQYQINATYQFKGLTTGAYFLKITQNDKTSYVQFLKQ
jgi:hypothetical protein